jgi:hypothetical protein
MVKMEPLFTKQELEDTRALLSIVMGRFDTPEQVRDMLLTLVATDVVYADAFDKLEAAIGELYDRIEALESRTIGSAIIN